MSGLKRLFTDITATMSSFVSEKRFNPDKVSKTHNFSVECGVLSDNFPLMTPQDGLKETWEHSSISKKRASDRNGDRRFRSPSGDVTQ